MTTATMELRRIPLTELHESVHNPRTRFDPTELRELADSLLASGQLDPLLVRPNPNGKGGFEIAAGACRRRAALIAGLTHLEAIVRELDDATFVEILNVENRQRHNLHALDEARGFADWMKTAGLKIPEIAARIGLSTKYVYDRLKLLQLTKPAQQLFLAGAFEAGHAILLARLTPADQARAIGDPSDRHNFADNRIGGLFQPEHIDGAPGLALEEPRKAVSVREFEAWINDHVRFMPEREDLPNLFPETLAMLHQAKEEEFKVIKITRDYRVSDEAKDPKERTYGQANWKRADGVAETPRFGGRAIAKTCGHAVLGVVVAGPGRGEAFKVCIAKEKCKTHWAREQKESVARAKTGSRNGRDDSEARRQEQWKRQEAEQEAARARFKQALPALLKAVVVRLANAPAGLDSALGKLLLGSQRYEAKNGFIPKGKSAEDLVRLLAFRELGGDALNEWRGPVHAPRLLKPLGIDVQKILDQAAPAPGVQTSAKPAKRLAGDVRRAAAKQRAAR